eukprot:161129_1
MSPFFVYLILSVELCLTQNSQRTTEIPTSAPTNYIRDCCERTTGLLYDAISCYDKNTPIIIKEAQTYLFNPLNSCKNTTQCSFSDESSLLSYNYPTYISKCLIS